MALLVLLAVLVVIGTSMSSPNNLEQEMLSSREEMSEISNKNVTLGDNASMQRKY